MSNNGNLAMARRVKDDEFYTGRSDIEAELRYYADHFRGKTVYCNCDDPAMSEFWAFFVRVFGSWGLKKLIATCYIPGGRGTCHVLTGSGIRSFRLSGDGGFRCPECTELLMESDIVVTNPPFSLFRDYMAQLISYHKKFLVIGSMNAVTYREFFPLLKDNLVWTGHTHPKAFTRPDGSLKTFGNIAWFTNLDIKKRHVPLDLRGNSYREDPARYPGYDNYDAIECGRVSDIPYDYDGLIGVPITFLDKYCPEQFELVWKAFGNTRASSCVDMLDSIGYRPHAADRGGLGVVDGRRMYARLLIKRVLT